MFQLLLSADKQMSVYDLNQLQDVLHTLTRMKTSEHDQSGTGTQWLPQHRTKQYGERLTTFF
jgi:hypothetical protein